jgi:hypothetical protein
MKAKYPAAPAPVETKHEEKWKVFQEKIHQRDPVSHLYHQLPIVTDVWWSEDLP